MRFKTDDGNTFFCYVVGIAVTIAVCCSTDNIVIWFLAIFFLSFPGVLTLFVAETLMPDTKEKIARNEHPKGWNKWRPQRPREAMRKAIGTHPTTEQLREYTDNHFWHRPPYCNHPEHSHCRFCKCRQDGGYYRCQGVLVKSGEILDCRGRQIITTPCVTLCATCKHATKHDDDEFFDCHHEWVATQDHEVPGGRNIYQPLFYKKKETCPYFEKDPAKYDEFKKQIPEQIKWSDALVKGAPIEI